MREYKVYLKDITEAIDKIENKNPALKERILNIISAMEGDDKSSLSGT